MDSKGTYTAQSILWSYSEVACTAAFRIACTNKFPFIFKLIC
jgi:hypothetical protein